MRRSLFALAALVLSAGVLLAEEEPQTVRSGEHFRIVVHFQDERVAEQALATVEALWPHAAALYGLAAGKLSEPLEVHLYRTTTDYERAEEKLTHGRFKRNLAFAHYDTQSAHVALQPESSDELLAAEGLPYLTRNLLLHEAAHVVRYRTIANHRIHPDWFADGAAQWLKFEALRGLRLITAVTQDPMSSTGILRGQKAAADVNVDRILDDDLADEEFYARYAAKRLFFAFLMDAHAEGMRTYVRKLSRLGTSADFKARAREALVGAVGAVGMADLQQAYATYVRGLRPAWSEVYRSLETLGEAWLQIAFPNVNAVAWRTQPVGKDRYVLSARVRILRNYGKQANLLLDQRTGGFVSVALTAGFGVSVFAYDAQKDAWDSRAAIKVPGLDLDEDHDVRLEIEGTRLRVLLDKQQVADVTFPEREGGLTGPWGLGAQSGTAVRWSGVKLD